MAGYSFGFPLVAGTVLGSGSTGESPVTGSVAALAFDQTPDSMRPAATSSGTSTGALQASPYRAASGTSTWGTAPCSGFS